MLESVPPHLPRAAAPRPPFCRRTWCAPPARMPALLETHCHGLLSPRACRAFLTLVARRWRSVFYEKSPGLWRSFRAVPRLVERRGDLERPRSILSAAEQARWADFVVALLARVTGMVEVFELQSSDTSTYARILHQLSPASARAVSLHVWYETPPEVCEALQQLTRLTSLSFDCHELPGSAAADMLRQLSSSLASLTLEVFSVPDEQPASLLVLSQLTFLDLVCHGPLPPFEWQRLQALQQLQHLTLCQDCSAEEDRLQAPLPATFPALSSFIIAEHEEEFPLQASSMQRRSFCQCGPTYPWVRALNQCLPCVELWLCC